MLDAAFTSESGDWLGEKNLVWWLASQRSCQHSSVGHVLVKSDRAVRLRGWAGWRGQMTESPEAYGEDGEGSEMSGGKKMSCT